MKKGEKEARAAVAQFLKNAELPVMLYRVSCIADHAAFEAGRKGELWGSLFDYEQIIPKGYACFWQKQGCGDVYVVGTTAQRQKYHHAPVPGVFDAGIDMGPPSSASYI